MAQESVSGGSPWCSPSEFLDRYDANLVGELVRDDGSRATVAEMVGDPPTTDPDSKLVAALADASGLVEAALLTGGKYTREDLATLDGNGVGFLRRLVADLAIGHLLDRRGPNAQNWPNYERATQVLERIRTGSAVLPLSEAVEAGQVLSEFMTESELDTLGLLSRRCRRVMGSRSYDLR
jgi:hypothetical protein